MEYLSAALLILVIAILFWMALNLKQRGKSEEQTQALLMLQKETESLRNEFSNSMTNHVSLMNQQLGQTASQVNEQLKSVTLQLQSSTGQLNQRMDNAAKVVGDVGRSLGQLSEATKQVYEVGKDIAKLQEILKAPKLRGGLGEFFLEDLLSQILPSANYKLQYTFKNSARVDAVIVLNERLVPVDAKFPLENFIKSLEATGEKEKNDAKKKFIKDVKLRIDEIASSYLLPEEGTFNFALMYIPAENVYYETIIKDEAAGEKEKADARKKFIKDVKLRIDEIASSYLLPEEGTFNFALMYIPAENVYYETIIKDESAGEEKSLVAYAFSKRVIPVSPNSFYAYLQTILLGLRGLEINEKAEIILRHLEGLKNDFTRFKDDFDVIGRHITNAGSKFNEADRKIEKFGEKLNLTAKGEPGPAIEAANTAQKKLI